MSDETPFNPARFGDQPQYRNPQSTLPMPEAKNVPIPLWVQTKMNLPWLGPFLITPGLGQPQCLSNEFRYTWSSPTFDLRPDLRSADGGPKNGVPIWSTSARLYIQLFGLQGTGLPSDAPTDGLTAFYNDFGNTTFAHHTGGGNSAVIGFDSVVRISGDHSITSAIIQPINQPDSVVIPIAPPGTELGGGEGYPLRYWRIEISFTKMLTVDEFPNPTAPVISFQAAYY